MKRFVVFALLFVLLLLFGLLLMLTLILVRSANSPGIAQESLPSPPQLSASPPQTEQPYLTRPPQTDQVVELFQGVTYTRDARQTPRPLMVHFVTVDLTTPGIRVLVTPGGEVDKLEMPARTTSEFLKEMALNLDGGGSTTLVVAEGSSPRTLNAPIHGGIPMLQRPVANHLGIYALPKTP